MDRPRPIQNLNIPVLCTSQLASLDRDAIEQFECGVTTEENTAGNSERFSSLDKRVRRRIMAVHVSAQSL